MDIDATKLTPSTELRSHPHILTASCPRTLLAHGSTSSVLSPEPPNPTEQPPHPQQKPECPPLAQTPPISASTPIITHTSTLSTTPQATQYQENWALLRRGILRLIGDYLVRWLQECPTQFWIRVEAEMEQVLRTQILQIPANTQFDRVVINLTSELAIVSPTIMLTSNVSPLWRELRAVILGLPPTRRIQNGIGTTSVPQDVEVHAAMTTVISLESTLIHIPFLVTNNITILVEIHQRIWSFRLSVDLLPLGML